MVDDRTAFENAYYNPKIKGEYFLCEFCKRKVTPNLFMRGDRGMKQVYTVQFKTKPYVVCKKCWSKYDRINNFLFRLFSLFIKTCKGSDDL